MIDAMTLSDSVTSTLFDGDFVPDVDVTGQVVDIWVRPYEDEIERRRALGVGAMLEHDVVRALFDMPAGVPLPPACLDGATLMAMDDLVELGAVEFNDALVTRIAVVPVEMVGISKVAECWDDARRITWLGTHAPRFVIAGQRIAKRVMDEVDPQVGVVLQHQDETRILRPAGSRRLFPSWQRWVLAERSFAKWLAVEQSD